MKDYIKLRCENTDFDDDFPDDLIRRREVYQPLHQIKHVLASKHWKLKVSSDESSS